MQTSSSHLRRSILACSAAALLASHAHAAEALPDIVVTAERVGQDQSAVSADVTVIDREQIERSQARTVADILRLQAGIDVAASGGPGKVTSVFLRGGNSGQTLVLIDGVRVGSATTGGFDWAHLSTADIERIEIVRGAQSSLYGADAMAGVIQIFTRTGAEGNKVRLRSEAGGHASSSGTLSVSGQGDGGVLYALSASGLRTAGVSAAANGTENDPYRRGTMSGSLGLPMGQGQLELRSRIVDGNTALDGGFPLGDVLNFTANVRQAVHSLKMNYPFSDTWESSIQLSRSTDEVVSRDPAGGFNNSDFRTRIDQLTWQNHLDLDAFSLLAGIDAYRSKGYSQSAGLDRAVSQTAGFAAFGYSMDFAEFHASIRHDRNSATTNQTTYKLGVAAYPLDSIKLSANYGTGFKAPSLNDLYFPASAFSAGNPDLKPERSRGWDVGLAYHYQQDDWQGRLKLVWFQQNYRDLIVWQGLPPTFFFTPTNIGRARARGIEVEWDLRYGPAYLQGAWTRLDAKDLRTGDWLPLRARGRGHVTIGGEYLGLGMEAVLHMVGSRYSSPGNQNLMQAYQKWDLHLRYAIDDRWSLTARVENATNKAYEEVAGYGVFGRTWYGGLRADL